MNSIVDRILARLRADWPGWKVWVIYPAVGGITWCAHRLGDERHVLNVGSADELAWAIECEEG